MRIPEHPESHIVKLDDGSIWQIFRAGIPAADCYSIT